MPALRPVLSHLLFQPNTEAANAMKVDNAEEEATHAFIQARPRERYYSLPFNLKVAILAFLCDLSATGKAVHNAMETCEATLTEMRKEKVELKRQQKKIADQLQAMLADKKKVASPQKNGTGTPKESTPKVNGKGKKKAGSIDQSLDGTPPPESQDSDHDSEDLLAANVADLTMDTTASEAPSDELMASGSISDLVLTPSKSGARTPRSSLRFKAQDQARVANKKKKEKDTDKVKDEPSGLSKQEEGELRQYEDEAAKVEQNLEQLELEFRQYLLLPRMRPLGKDRFHCKVWWFDGVGCMSLRSTDGEIQYGTGKIFIQGPSQDDIALIDAKTEADPSVGLRREAEEGAGLLAPGQWAWYETPEEVCRAKVLM
jgi:bromodomain adjacent to zinc finger domain protein 1A